MVSVHTTPKKLQKRDDHPSFGFVLKKKKPRTHDYRKVIIFKELRFKFSVHTGTKGRRFQIPPLRRFSKYFEKFRYRDGLVWTVGLTVVS